jgi:acetyltransferase
MRSFFDPRSVVLIGVPRQSGIGAYNNLEMMLRFGYQRPLYLVHPKVPEILGHKTFKNVAELPEIPELAVISVGRERVLPVFIDCAHKGIRHVIVISQGFSDADERGKEFQKQLVEIAQEHGVRIVGPNTMGVLNVFDGFSTAFVDIPRDPSPPPLSLIAQSGVLQVGFETFLERVGKAIDIGNGCDADFVDMLEYFENDPQTQIIVIHMEGMRRGREFLRTAARIAHKKPIIIFKTGRSAAGAQAALSHTGSLVGEDALFDMAFDKAGLIRVRNMVELRAVCQAFLHFRPMSGPGLGVVTATGACGIMSADACEDHGLELAPFPESIRNDLENPHIAWHHLRNPVDIWPLGMVSGSFVDVLKRAVKGLMQDDQVDGVLTIAPVMSSPLHEDLNLLDVVRDIQATNVHHKPLAIWLYGDGAAHHGEVLNGEKDTACFASIDEAIMGLGATWRYQRFQKKEIREDDFPIISPGRSRPVSLPNQELIVDESAFALLEHCKIPFVPGSLAQDAPSAASIALELGYPVVLKIISPQWVHKSDWGGVRLNVATREELQNSYAELENLFRQRTPDGHLKGILVQKQIQGTELLFGIKKDPQFGPVLVVGTGGIYTEVFKDVTRSLIPVSRIDAEAMLQSLRIYPILEGIRGQKGTRLSTLVDVAQALSQLALDYPEIAELDLNPVMANAEGCWCVDCRIVLGS